MPAGKNIFGSDTQRLKKRDLVVILSSFFYSQQYFSQSARIWSSATASAFSVSKSEVDIVCKYILNKREHYRKVSFAEEYNQLVKYYQNLEEDVNKLIRLESVRPTNSL
jgi:hypothetical protein